MRHPIHTDYDVAEDGTVTSYARGKPRVLKQWPNMHGYPSTSIRQKKVQVHVLVLETYRGLRPAGMVARHLNGDKLPHLKGLAWSTQAENLKDKRLHGTDHNLNKTHCPAEHPYDAANTRLRTDRPGNRECRSCDNARQRRRYHQQKETAA